MFKSWSDLNPDAKKYLKPDFGIRKWNSLTQDEKYKIWQYLYQWYFFNIYPRDENNFSPLECSNYNFILNEGANKHRIINSIAELNEKFKARSYASKYLENPSLNSACFDFYNIFINQDENVVLELLSLYSMALIDERKNINIKRAYDETEEEYQVRLQNWRWEDFDIFAQDLNKVFTDFGLNVYLTRQGFIPRQEEKIIEDIYKPVLSYLSHPKWREINNILSDGFKEYEKNTPQGYSSCVTHTFSAVQAFLQILVFGKTGKGNISELINEGQKRSLLPDDIFTETIFNNIETIFSRERMQKGDAHPKKEYATEKNARTLLNLAMIFFQHCIQNDYAS